MMSGVMTRELVSVVERERMVEIARNQRIKEIARGGRMLSRTERVSGIVRALKMLMGRPRERGAAPAGGRFATRTNASAEIARTTTGSMAIARF
jgi:hypothetical protein